LTWQGQNAAGGGGRRRSSSPSTGTSTGSNAQIHLPVQHDLPGNSSADAPTSANAGTSGIGPGGLPAHDAAGRLLPELSQHLGGEARAALALGGAAAATTAALLVISPPCSVGGYHGVARPDPSGHGGLVEGPVDGGDEGPPGAAAGSGRVEQDPGALQRRPGREGRTLGGLLGRRHWLLGRHRARDGGWHKIR